MAHSQKTGYLAIALLLILPLFSSRSDAVIISDLSESLFTGATIEVFSPATVQASTFDFGNGMTFTNLDGDLDFVKYMDPGGYGLGDAGIIFEGRDADAYFGTLEPLTSFSFDFVDGINGFGFFGGESVFRSDVDERDGFLDLEFYGLDSSFLGSLRLDTNGNTPFDTFYGFGSTGAPIGSVRFVDVGYLVLDDVQFGVFAAIPEPTTALLMYFGILPLIAMYMRSRSRSRKLR